MTLGIVEIKINILDLRVKLPSIEIEGKRAVAPGIDSYNTSAFPRLIVRLYR